MQRKQPSGRARRAEFFVGLVLVMAGALATAWWAEREVRLDVISLTNAPAALGFKLKGERPIHMRVGYQPVPEDRYP